MGQMCKLENATVPVMNTRRNHFGTQVIQQENSSVPERPPSKRSKAIPARFSDSFIRKEKESAMKRKVKSGPKGKNVAEQTVTYHHEIVSDEENGGLQDKGFFHDKRSEYNQILNPLDDTVHIVVGSLSDICRTELFTAPYRRLAVMQYQTCNNWPGCIKESKNNPFHHFLHMAKKLNNTALNVKIAAVIEDTNTKSKNSNDVYNCHEGNLETSLHKFRYPLAFSMILMVRPKTNSFGMGNESRRIFGGPSITQPTIIIPDDSYKPSVKNFGNHHRSFIAVGSTFEPKVVIDLINGCNTNKGDWYLWRLLISHVKSPTSFMDLFTNSGIVWPWFTTTSNLRGLFPFQISQSEALAATSTMKHLFAYLYAPRKKHLAASKGYEAITHFLIQEGVDVNISDNFGSTPLLEALKNGHDRVASVLVKEGAALKINDAGSFLCTVIAKGDSDFLKRLLSNGVDPNSKDYDHRTPLHVAASEGLYLMAKLLLESGASIIEKDRWGNTPLDEARMCGNKNLIKLLEDAQFSQLPELPSCTTDKQHRRKCTVFPFHPWESKDQRRPGIVLWVPKTMEELIKTASEKLDFPSSSCALTEDGGKILDVDMISDDQKLYLISQTH